MASPNSCIRQRASRPWKFIRSRVAWRAFSSSVGRTNPSSWLLRLLPRLRYDPDNATTFQYARSSARRRSVGHLTSFLVREMHGLPGGPSFNESEPGCPPSGGRETRS